MVRSDARRGTTCAPTREVPGLSRMERFFTPRGDAALAAVMRLDPVPAFDFDGAQCLAELAQRHVVAVISGRSVGDVRARLGFEPRFVVGNHGAEDGAGALPEAAVDALDALRARVAETRAALAAAGVAVEDKR